MKIEMRKEFALSLTEFEVMQLKNFMLDCKVWDNNEEKTKSYYTTAIGLWVALNEIEDTP
jgi:hypothetical protein